MNHLLSAITVDCGKNSMSVRWAETKPQVDPYSLLLGDCPPTQVSVKPDGAGAVFYAEFGACSIRRMVSLRHSLKCFDCALMANTID